MLRKDSKWYLTSLDKISSFLFRYNVYLKGMTTETDSGGKEKTLFLICVCVNILTNKGHCD